MVKSSINVGFSLPCLIAGGYSLSIPEKSSGCRIVENEKQPSAKQPRTEWFPTTTHCFWEGPAGMAQDEPHFGTVQ